MYSFEALQAYSTFANRDGFYTMAFLSIMLWMIVSFAICLIFEVWDETKLPFIIATSICLGVIGYSYHVSATTGYNYNPKNEVVIGTFDGFQPEAFSVKSGKATRTVNQAYVVYVLPDGSKVLMKANPGDSYPEKAILYKN